MEDNNMEYTTNMKPQGVSPNKRNLRKTRIRILPEKVMSPRKFASLFPNYRHKYPVLQAKDEPPISPATLYHEDEDPAPVPVPIPVQVKKELNVPVPTIRDVFTRSEIKPLRYIPKVIKEKKKPTDCKGNNHKSCKGKPGTGTSQDQQNEQKIKQECVAGSSKTKRQYLRRRLPVNIFNRINKETEYGFQFKNYFSYLFLVGMQDFSAVLDDFQMSNGSTFKRFQQIASIHKISHVFYTTTIVIQKFTKKNKFKKFATKVIFDAARDLWLSKMSTFVLTEYFEGSMLKRRLGAFFLLYYLYNFQPIIPKERIPFIDEDINDVEIFTEMIERQDSIIQNETSKKSDFASEYRFILLQMKLGEYFKFGRTRFKHETLAEMVNLHHDQSKFRSINSILNKEGSVNCQKLKGHLFSNGEWSLQQLYLLNYLDIRRRLSAQETLEKYNEIRSSPSSPLKKRALISNENLSSEPFELINNDMFLAPGPPDPELSEEQKVLEEAPFLDQLDDTCKKLQSIVEKDHFDLRLTLGDYYGERFYKEELQSIANERMKNRQCYQKRKKRLAASKKKKKRFPNLNNLRAMNFMKGLPGCSNKNFVEIPTISEYKTTLIPPLPSLSQNKSTSSSSGNQFNNNRMNSSHPKTTCNSSVGENSLKNPNTDIPPPQSFRSRSTSHTIVDITSSDSESDNESDSPDITPLFQSESRFVNNNSKSPNIPPSFRRSTTSPTCDFKLDNNNTTTNPHQSTSTSMDYSYNPPPISTDTKYYNPFQSTDPSIHNPSTLDHFGSISHHTSATHTRYLDNLNSFQYTDASSSTHPSFPNSNVLDPFDSNICYNPMLIPMIPIETTNPNNNVTNMFDDYLKSEIIIDNLENGEEVEIQLQLG